MLRKLLILAVLLGWAMPVYGVTWSPLQIPNVALFVSGAHTSHMWKESIDTNQGYNHPALTDLVGRVDDGAGGFQVMALSDGSRPTLNGSGGKSWLTFTTGKRLQVYNSQGLRFLHRAPAATFLAKVRLTTASSGANQVLFDCLNSTSAAIGFMVYVDATGHLGILNGDGSASILTGTLLTTATLSNNTWHDLVVTLDQAGTGVASVQIDTTTAVTRTYANAGNNADATGNYVIAARTAGTNPWIGDVKNITIVSGSVSAGDLALWRAYDPDQTTTSLAVATNSANSILPTDVPFLHRWYDTSDVTTMWTTSAKSTQVSVAGTDRIGYVENKKPIRSGSSWKRQASQSTDAKRPLYKASQFGSVAAGYWDGSSANATGGDWTGEQDLVFNDSSPTGGKTIIVVYKQSDSSQGSHILAGATGARYAVQTGSGYTMGTYGWVVTHSTDSTGTGQAQDSPRAANPEGINIWTLRQEGGTSTQYMNGNAGTTSAVQGLLDPLHMGRAAHSDAGGSWDMLGSIGVVLIYNAILDPSDVQKITNGLAVTFGATAAYRTGNQQNKLGIGINLQLSAYEQRQEDFFHALAP